MPINPTQGTPSTGADPGNFGNLQISGLFAESVATYVPFNGGGQSSATKIVTELAYISTSVATSAPFDSVVLPPTSLVNVIGPGLTLFVINKSANPIQVFGSGRGRRSQLAEDSLATFLLYQPPTASPRTLVPQK